MVHGTSFNSTVIAPVDPAPMLDWIGREGILLQARGSMFGEQVFLCVRGKRHPVISAARIEELGFRWPDDVQHVPERQLASYAPGGGVPKPWSGGIDAKIATADATAMREAITASLNGFGLEIGAGASPFPVPLRCRVVYGDRLAYDQLCAERYPGQRVFDIVIPDITTDLDTIENVADSSLDFLIACHVIEHTRNPIGAIATAWRKLKPGGRLVLVVPEKQRTFDRDRPLTPLEHLVEDHLDPDRARDFAHYEEFYTLAQPVPESHRGSEINRQFDRGFAIHYHVWTHDSFVTMLDYVTRSVSAWSHIWTHQAVADESRCIEFYAVLVK